MARADWRSAGAYEDLRPLDAPAFAYEFLLPQPDFLSDHARLARSSRKRTLDAVEAGGVRPALGGAISKRNLDPARHAALLDGPDAPERGDPDETPGRPRRSSTWPRRAQPPIRSRCRRRQIRSSNCAERACGFTARIKVGAPRRRPPAARPALRHPRRRRAPPVARADRAARRAPTPALLTPERRNRLILALRALDGRLERATYPEIAAVLFDTEPHLQARLDFARTARSDRPARPARILR